VRGRGVAEVTCLYQRRGDYSRRIPGEHVSKECFNETVEKKVTGDLIPPDGIQVYSRFIILWSGCVMIGVVGGG